MKINIILFTSDVWIFVVKQTSILDKYFKNSRMMSGACSLPPSINDMSLFKLECTLKVEGMTIHIEEQVVIVFMLCVLLALILKIT